MSDGGLDLLVGGRDDLLGLGVDAIDERRRVALHAHLLHGRLRAIVVRPRLRDRIGEVVRQPIGRIVRHLLAVEPAHVAGRARRHEHVARRQRLRRRVELQQLLLRVKHDAVLRLFVDLELRVIRPDVALAARRRQPRDRDRRGVARVARRARADRAVVVRLADAVALRAAARGRRRAFERASADAPARRAPPG